MCKKVTQKPYGYAKDVVLKYWLEIIKSRIDTPVQVMIYRKHEADYREVVKGTIQHDVTGGCLQEGGFNKGCSTTNEGTNVLKMIDQKHTHTMLYNKEVIISKLVDSDADEDEPGGESDDWSNLHTQVVDECVVVCKVVSKLEDATHHMYLTKDTGMVMLFENNPEGNQKIFSSHKG